MTIFKRYRIDNELTQVDVAKKCKMTQAAWSNLEHGNRNLTMDTIDRILKGTTLTFEDLYNDYRKGLRTRKKSLIR